jgi:signal transduction histidine kinase
MNPTLNYLPETPGLRTGSNIISLQEERPRAGGQQAGDVRLQEIGAQTAKIAHDLNNLLAPLLMALEVFRPHLDDSSHVVMLDIARKSTLRAADLVRQILTFARGAQEERREIDPASVVEEIGAFARATFPSSLTVNVVVPENLSPIMGCATQLHRALLNLCVNARDAMAEGGTLTLRAANVSLDSTNIRMPRGKRGGRYVLFEVGDTGTGIPEAIREKIFDPFFTTKGAGKGTGLGLASVRSIVENHAGLLSLQTEPGKGTTFHILIPTGNGTRPAASAGHEIRIVAA